MLFVMTVWANKLKIGKVIIFPIPIFVMHMQDLMLSIFASFAFFSSYP